MADVGPAGQQTGHLAVKFDIGIGETRKIFFFENRGAKAWLCKDHYPGCGLQQMRAGAAADDEEKRILHLAVQPDDPGQSAEHLALAALLQDGGVTATALGQVEAHSRAPRSSRAWRSFHRNCAALMT